MKTTSLILAFACVCGGAAGISAQPPGGTPPAARVGVYDSRAVAFAHFWAEPARKERDALIAQAKAAKAAGNTTQFKELAAKLEAAQSRSHLQVFSTAPADEAMAALEGKLPAIQQELGVERLVSKWEAGALKAIPESSRVDATDRLVHELLPAPTEKQRKTLEALKAAKPLSLWRVKLLNTFGKI